MSGTLICPVLLIDWLSEREGFADVSRVHLAPYKGIP